jgi:dTMP kinase
MSRRGRFITFEGMDGSGKTTQIRLLADRLRSQGREVLESVEPGGTAIGRKIRQILLDTANHGLGSRAELLLYFAGRAQNVEEWIQPALERGALVLSDRFTDSTVAYQGYGRGLGVETVLTLHNIACGGLNPDLTLFLDIDLETSLSRARNRQGGSDRMEEQAAEFYTRVRNGYLQMAAREPERIIVLDANDCIESVAGRIWEVVRTHV